MVYGTHFWYRKIDMVYTVYEMYCSARAVTAQARKKMGVSIEEFIIATLWMHVSLVVSVAYIAIVKI